MIERREEKARLESSLKSRVSELIVVYGRRRVGKTYLIRNVYKDHIKYELTGLYSQSKGVQLKEFHNALKKVSRKFEDRDVPDNWSDAFNLLKEYINRLRGKNKKVIFIDEFPWLDTHKSDFLAQFSHFWNVYCEKRDDLVVVVCGSAASYMVQNIISTKGGLHNRLSYKLRIQPFNLYETKLYLESKNINWEPHDIIHLYIALGGVPFYLNKIQKGQSLVQNIQRLCFDKDGDLVNEFEDVFKSLFSNSENHMKIVKALGKVQKGVTRKELLERLKMTSSGPFSNALSELEASGFITQYSAFHKKAKETLFRLTDEYSNFYLKYIEPNKNQGEGFWRTTFQKQTYISWAGFNFESICLKHVNQIKQALDIGGIRSTNSSWSTEGAQVDLVIERDDNWINLCEMKFYNKEYNLDAPKLKALNTKKSKFKDETKTKKNIGIIMITSFGITGNHENVVERDFTMDVLFEK